MASVVSGVRTLELGNARIREWSPFGLSPSQIEIGPCISYPSQCPDQDESFDFGPELGTRGWEALSLMTDLENLSIRGIKDLTRHGSPCFARLRQLKRLRLADSDITDTWIPHLQYLVNLKELEITSGTIKDTGMKVFSKFENLEFLHVESDDNDGCSDEGLRYLSKLKKLRHLVMNSKWVTGRGIQQIARMPSLEIVAISEAQVDSAAINAFRGHPNLKVLNLDHCSGELEDDAFESIGTMKRLRILNLPCSLSHQKLRCLKQIPNLGYLCLGSFKKGQLTDSDFEELSQLKELRVLMLEDVRITNSALDHLSRLTWLRFLRLRGDFSQITGTRLEHFAESSNKLVVLEFEGASPLVSDDIWEGINEGLQNRRSNLPYRTGD